MTIGIRTDTKQLKSHILNILLQSSLRSIPFNATLGALLAFYLYFIGAPITKIIIWYSVLFLYSFVRLFYSIWLLRSKIPDKDVDTYIRKFTILTFIMGSIWGLTYFYFQPYIHVTQAVIIVLTMGGMAAGAIASLCAYLPAYAAFVVPMFLPLITVDLLSGELEKIILPIMYSLFVIMLIITAKVNSKLLLNNFILGMEKDWLIKKLSEMNNNLENSNEKLVKSIEEIRTMSITDPLTGLYNRRHFNFMLKNELDRAKRNGYILDLILIDIDNFKYINDTFGHPSGDDFLLKTAEIIKPLLKRANDSLYRLGGDEFAIILANLPKDSAELLCGKIKDLFNEHIQDDKVSLSISLISIQPQAAQDLDVKELISQADQLLYQAKNLGKNRINVKILD